MIVTGTRTATIVALLVGNAATTMPLHAGVTVSSAATKNMTCANGLCAPTAKDAVLNAGDLETLLASGNVDISTTGSGVQADDIRIDAPFGWSASSTLTLDAYESILVGKPVAVSGQGGLAVATNDGGSGGTFWFAPKGNVTFANPSSALTINGASYTLITTLPALASAIAANPSGAYALANSYDAEQDSTYTAAPVATTFAGTFEGLGNTISHLEIAGAAPMIDLGLFADVGKSGMIASVRLSKLYIRAKKESTVGAIVAINYGTLLNSIASGKIGAAAGFAAVVGGVVAENEGNIYGTAAAVMIHVGSRKQSTQATVGGLVGLSNGTIETSYATGTVTMRGSAGATSLGGGIGFNNGIISDCYADGNSSELDAEAANVGGMVGENGLTLESSYSVGVPIGGDGSYVGGLIGLDLSGLNGGTLNHTYWDMTTSGIEKNQGAGNIPNDPGIKGKTTKQLRSGLPNGFDPKIWAENPKINGGLPYLIDNPPQ